MLAFYDFWKIPLSFYFISTVAITLILQHANKQLDWGFSTITALWYCNSRLMTTFKVSITFYLNTSESSVYIITGKEASTPLGDSHKISSILNVKDCYFDYNKYIWRIHICPMGFFRQEYWSGLPFPSPGDLPNPGIKPRSPKLQVDSLPSEPPGKTITNIQEEFKALCVHLLHLQFQLSTTRG